MKKQVHGPSQFYATDKNVFDALNQHKVDNPTILKLFERRNIIVGKKTPREELAKYFARLTHDYYDHQDIAKRLGITTRRERLTSLDLKGLNDKSDIQAPIDQLKAELESTGNVIQVSGDADNVTINIQYSTIDYKLSELSQVQAKDGTIEFEKTPEGYIIRNTDNEHMNDLRESLLGKIEKSTTTEITKSAISLFDITSPKERSKFFYDLIKTDQSYRMEDVTSVFTYRAKPDDDSDEGEVSDEDTYIEKVSLSGSGVSRSELLNQLLDNDDFYIIKVRWEAKQLLKGGHVYDIEATFSNPQDCTGFSYILKGVYQYEEGKVSSQRRTPTKEEIKVVSQAVEAKSRDLVKKLDEQRQTEAE
ncbi:hypothetical protein A9Q78_01365 [Methylophaga sp. 41_12_T18]|nr:hypothetical protein A9Q78_01365 [Methylophaga sp. 41_12_T18]